MVTSGIDLLHHVGPNAEQGLVIKILTLYKFLHNLLMEPFKAMTLLWHFLQVLNKIRIQSSSSKDLTSELFGAQLLLTQPLLKPPKKNQKTGLCFCRISWKLLEVHISMADISGCFSTTFMTKSFIFMFINSIKTI